MNIIVGTAGHIDHGKTALIKALTGTDTDRLPEEKKRGITIDIGFAEMSLGEHHIGFVDVPGHERFVKNMLAGASGIDLVMLIIASDEGVMPQTREHFDICRLLGVNNGIIVLTKTDLVDEELLDLVRLDAAELVEGSFLETAPVAAVSSKTGSGIAELKQLLADAASSTATRTDDLVTRLPIDRSFVVKGFGTVVTGTVAGGSIAEGAEMELLPIGRKVRVRGLQSHGRETASVSAGQRAAVNLANISQDEIERGLVLSEPGVLRPVEMFNARVEVLAAAEKPLRSRQRVRVHSGTAEVLARVHIINAAGEIAPGETDLAQLRLETAAAVVPGERFIIRSYSPQVTIAGGKIVDTAPAKHRKRDTESSRQFLNDLIDAENDRPKTAGLIISSAGRRGITHSELLSRTGWRSDVVTQAAAGPDIVRLKDTYISATHFEDLKTKTAGAVAGHHRRDPLSAGMPREALRDKIFGRVPIEVFEGVLAVLTREGKLRVENDRVGIAGHKQELGPTEQKVIDALRKLYTEAALEVPKTDDALSTAAAGTKASPAEARKLLQVLVNAGELRKATEDLYFSAAAIDGLIARLRENAGPDRLIDVAKFKDIAGVSRKYAIPLLEYLDNIKVTVRSGDRRMVL